jgi:phosphoglycolate phosphatase-like HAD superfamily hydrolase
MTASRTDGTTTAAAPSPYAAVPNPPPTKTASAVIFDIDGTLADSWRLGYDATAVVLQNNDLAHRVEFNEDIYHETCVYATPERLARTAGLTPESPNFEAVGADLGRQFDDHYVKLVSPQTCAFYPGMLDVLEKLPRETKLGALTNACVDYGHAVLKANCPVRTALDNTYGLGFALYSRFDTIHGADSVPAPKPSPEGLLQCAREIGLENELGNIVYVGDAIGDGKAARAAGMVSVGVLWGSNSEEKLRNADTFDYIVGSVEELRELLPQQE